MAFVLKLGSISFINCDTALTIEGEEVFRLRERTGDGRLVVDFDVRDDDGEMVAKVAKNNVVFARSGYEFRNEARVSEVYEAASGRMVARAEEQSLNTVAVTGEFVVGGFHIKADEDGMTINGNAVTFKNCTFDRHGSAITIKNGQLMIG